MVQTLEAVYDGTVLRPDEPLPLEANTRVRVTVETFTEKDAAPLSFLEVARSLRLDGPPDWSRNLDRYLYGDEDAPTS
jgi:predicted DNA-binding antitoxin AbrB/MazE fold protein